MGGSVKERENMHKGQGLNEGFREWKVREIYYRPGAKHYLRENAKVDPVFFFFSCVWHSVTQIGNF